MYKEFDDTLVDDVVVKQRWFIDYAVTSYAITQHVIRYVVYLAYVRNGLHQYS